MSETSLSHSLIGKIEERGRDVGLDLERRGRERIYPRGRGTNGSGNPGDIKGLPCKNGWGGGRETVTIIARNCAYRR